MRETAVSALNQRFLNFNYVYITFLGLKRLLKNPLSIRLLSAFCIIYLFIFLSFCEIRESPWGDYFYG